MLTGVIAISATRRGEPGEWCRDDPWDRQHVVEDSAVLIEDRQTALHDRWDQPRQEKQRAEEAVQREVPRKNSASAMPMPNWPAIEPMVKSAVLINALVNSSSLTTAA